MPSSAQEVIESYHNVYLTEIGWNCSLVIQACQDLFKLYPVEETSIKRYIANSPEAHELISRIYSSASIVSKFLMPKGRATNEREVAYQFRNRRGEHLRSIVNVPIPEMRRTQLRNSLEHLDEKLDEHFRRLIGSPDTDLESLLYNFVFSHRDFLDILDPRISSNSTLIRAYISSEEVFLNLNSDLNIRGIYNEAVSITEVIPTLLPASEVGAYSYIRLGSKRPPDGEESSSGGPDGGPP